jgi:hypothetical protein
MQDDMPTTHWLDASGISGALLGKVTYQTSSTSVKIGRD